MDISPITSSTGLNFIAKSAGSGLVSQTAPLSSVQPSVFQNELSSMMAIIVRSASSPRIGTTGLTGLSQLSNPQSGNTLGYNKQGTAYKSSAVTGSFSIEA